MKRLFQGTQFTGVVKPGEVYILTEYGYKLDQACALYTIKTDEEAYAAADLHLRIICREECRFDRLLGIESLDEDAHLIKFLCRDIVQQEDVEIVLVLERLKSFQEESDRLNELLPRDSELTAP